MFSLFCLSRRKLMLFFYICPLITDTVLIINMYNWHLPVIQGTCPCTKSTLLYRHWSSAHCRFSFFLITCICYIYSESPDDTGYPDDTDTLLCPFNVVSILTEICCHTDVVLIESVLWLSIVWKSMICKMSTLLPTDLASFLLTLWACSSFSIKIYPAPFPPFCTMYLCLCLCHLHSGAQVSVFQ